MVLKIDGKKVTRIDEVEVGDFAEGVVFSPDGKYIYAGSCVDRDVSILKVAGAKARPPPYAAPPGSRWAPFEENT